MTIRTYTEGVLSTKQHALEVISCMKETMHEIASVTGLDKDSPVLTTGDVIVLLTRIEKEIEDNATINTLIRDIELRGPSAYEGNC